MQPSTRTELGTQYTDHHSVRYDGLNIDLFLGSNHTLNQIESIVLGVCLVLFYGVSKGERFGGHLAVAMRKAPHLSFDALEKCCDEVCQTSQTTEAKSFSLP